MNTDILDSYIKYIFDFFKRSHCSQAGNGNMLRNFIFGVEKQFPRNQQQILYFFVDTLIDNGYLFLKDKNFIAITEDGADVINGGENVIPKISLDLTIYETGAKRSDVYESLWNIIGPNKGSELAPLYVDGPLFYNTIRPYLASLSLPHTYSEYMEEFQQKGEFTSRIKWYRTLFFALDENDVPNFLRDLSLKINALLVNSYKNEAEDEFNPWADVDVPIIEDKPQPVVPINPNNNEIDVEKPLVLISYAWEEEDIAYMNWIVTFAAKLRANGINAQIDRYQPHGTDLPKFMLDSIRNATKVLCVLTPKYKEKAESGKGGAAYEGGIISHEIYRDQDTIKFIPILRKGTFEISTPSFIDGRKGFDCTSDEKYKSELANIIKAIKGEPVVEIPPIQ